MKIIAQSRNRNIGGTGVTGVLLLLLIIGTVSPTLIVGTVNQPPLQSTGYIGYIEPGLRTLAANQKVSVIISGTDVHQITSLVEQAGGRSAVSYG